MDPPTTSLTYLAMSLQMYSNISNNCSVLHHSHIFFRKYKNVVFVDSRHWLFYSAWEVDCPCALLAVFQCLLHPFSFTKSMSDYKHSSAELKEMKEIVLTVLVIYCQLCGCENWAMFEHSDWLYSPRINAANTPFNCIRTTPSKRSFTFQRPVRFYWDGGLLTVVRFWTAVWFPEREIFFEWMWIFISCCQNVHPVLVIFLKCFKQHFSCGEVHF